MIASLSEDGFSPFPLQSLIVLWGMPVLLENSFCVMPDSRIRSSTLSPIRPNGITSLWIINIPCNLIFYYGGPYYCYDSQAVFRRGIGPVMPGGTIAWIILLCRISRCTRPRNAFGGLHAVYSCFCSVKRNDIIRFVSENFNGGKKKWRSPAID